MWHGDMPSQDSLTSNKESDELSIMVRVVPQGTDKCTHVLSDIVVRESLTSLGVFLVQHDIEQILLVDRVSPALRDD